MGRGAGRHAHDNLGSDASGHASYSDALSQTECFRRQDVDLVATAERKLLDVLERLLSLPGRTLSETLDEASHLVGEALDADKVDVFLYDAASDSLVAAGTSRTAMGRRQHAIGLDRLPLANGGPTVRVFKTGQSRQTG